MATVVNNPAPAAAPSDSGNGMGFLVGIILLIFFLALFFVYGLPYLSSAMRGPQINVPGKVDVNVHSNGQ